MINNIILEILEITRDLIDFVGFFYFAREKLHQSMNLAVADFYSCFGVLPLKHKENIINIL